jgi:predicted RNA-binding protein with PIN domain
VKFNLTYLIDANNVIGKDKELFTLQKKDKISSREVLAHRIDRSFSNKKINVMVFFDGFKTLAIKTSKARIFYSDNKTADDLIKDYISDAVNKKNITVVTSDHNVQQFARVCSCTVKSSEDFLKEISRRDSDSEESRINSIDNEEIKKLFGL